jgi:dTDP-4-amino-4,6-dideoxy-D-galactose acyltransferase
MISLTSQLQILDWDTEIFGYKVAKINAKNTSINDFNLIKNEITRKGIRLAYWFVDPLDENSILALEHFKYKPIERKITYSKSIKDVDLPITQNIFEYKSREFNQQLLNLSYQSGFSSRYKLDFNFTNKEFEKLYKLYITNSIKKTIADHIFVYIHEQKIAGFVTLKVDKSFSKIGLIAVDTFYRGRSIGSKLVDYVSHFSYKNNCKRLDVVTQAENTQACLFYEAKEFSILETKIVYHIWNRNSN